VTLNLIAASETLPVTIPVWNGASAKVAAISKIPAGSR